MRIMEPTIGSNCYISLYWYCHVLVMVVKSIRWKMLVLWTKCWYMIMYFLVIYQRLHYFIYQLYSLSYHLYHGVMMTMTTMPTMTTMTMTTFMIPLYFERLQLEHILLSSLLFESNAKFLPCHSHPYYVALFFCFN